MSNSQKTKVPGMANVSAAALTEGRPFPIDYWTDLSMSTESTPTIRGAFMEESAFNELGLVKAVQRNSLNEIRMIQDRMRSWFLSGVEKELSEATPDHFSERLYAINDLDVLLEMAVVGQALETKTFYYLTMAQFQTMDSDRAMFIKEFYRLGFYHFCMDYAKAASLFSRNKAGLALLDNADIKDHTMAFWLVDEFISHVLTAMQTYEVNGIANASTPA